MPTPGNRPSHSATADAPAERPPPQATAARAMGMLMAATPCSARDARLILAAAADLVHITVHDLAAAMTAAATPTATAMPARIERALRHAVEAARTRGSARARPAALTPNRARTEEVLTRLRGCQARLTATPEDPGALRAMDDAASTLCVLMGSPTTHEAVLAAERHLVGEVTGAAEVTPAAGQTAEPFRS